MRIFKTKLFDRWASKEGLKDKALKIAAEELANGLFDAALGGHVYKKRIGLQGRGRRGGVRTLLAYRLEGHVFYLYGFAKNERANIDAKELKALRILAAELLNYSDEKLAKAKEIGELIEVEDDE